MRSSFLNMMGATTAVFLAACLGGGGGYESDADGGGDDGGNEPPAQRFSSGSLAGEGEIVDAVGANLEEQGPMTVVVSLDSGGLASFALNDAGEPGPLQSALADTHFTGLTMAKLDDSGQLRVAAMADDRTLYALDASTLEVLWSLQVAALADAGAVVAGDYDTDGDDDVACFRANYTVGINVEATGSGWAARDQYPLPNDMLGIAAGDLGGSPHPEFLFMGVGAMIEVVAQTDWAYNDIRPVGLGSHARAAFGDFDGDGDGDAAVTTPGVLEMWAGDGATNIMLGSSSAVGAAAIRDLTALERADETPSVAVVLEDGALAAVHLDEEGAWRAGSDAFTSSPAARRILTGDVDGDADVDAVVIAGDRTVHIWRDPQ